MDQCQGRETSKGSTFEELTQILLWERDKTHSMEGVTEIDIESSRQNDYTQAAHVLLFARNDETLWKSNKKHAAVMMQMRFDGMLGFPGGLLDSREETPVDALNRELSEEIGLDVSVHSIHQGDHLVSHIHHAKRIVTHFYTKELSMDEFVEVERGASASQDWGGECLGVIRVPLYQMMDKTGAPSPRGLPYFLTHRFAGNARCQLVHALSACHVLPWEDIVAAVRTYASISGIPGYTS